MSCKIFLSLFLLLILFCSASSADKTTQRNNITLGSSLTAQPNQNESWISPNEDFAFGFQQIRKDGFILSIWFNKIPQRTIVWSANRDNLVQQGSTVQLTNFGSLELRDSTGRDVWSAAASGSGVSHPAMLDIGNFVLTNQKNFYLWESFHEPTDTLLPTQYLGQGKKLVSRYSESDYSSGRFHFRVGDNGATEFSARGFPVDSDSYNVVYELNMLSQGNGMQVMFNQSGFVYLQAQNGTIIEWLTSSNSIFSKGFYQRVVLDYHGVFRHYVYPKDDDRNSRGWPSGKWSQTSPSIPKNICLSIKGPYGPGACGYNSYCSVEIDGTPNCQCPIGYTFVDPDDKMKGCRPNFKAQNCDEDSKDVNNFVMYTMENTYSHYGDFEATSPVSEDWCLNYCLVDCFCALVIYENDSCWKKKNPISNGMRDYSMLGKAMIKVRQDSIVTSKPSNHSINSFQETLILIGSVLLSSSGFLNIVLLITSLVLFFLLGRKTSITKLYQNMPKMNLRSFTFSELEKATNGFKEKLGVGAFGAVFKGVVQLGDNNTTSAIAVKKLDNKKLVKDGDQEFTAEVMSIGRTNHKNLVKLIGFCNEGQHRLLVYDYMSNGSLATILFETSNKPNWNQRMRIAFGIARGLFYLHEECSTQIIHCDIKPQNILLDDSYTARISDFGLAKILKNDQTRTTTRIRGTKGYVAPEWFKNMAVTVKVDVYSYGILLLELICCRKNFEEDVEDDASMILSDWACDCYESGKVKCLVENDDEAMMEIKMVEKYVMVTLWCIQEDPSLRPTMKKVMLMLEGSVKVSAPPLPNSFISSL
ncbi:G-type lectin S-receptor-like serine/threonine-protein kinase LECRK3 [Cannabis sativa]|uniref:G-type lectin S-receptor-like serine/threonine-protein kinase LECRK3 n=1 Tax=Cannabis sativa TaxID=3483 RepID=UPI0029CA0874|nr:G-type lectin S-receptor-like serine/threonine-protein kinase LECRK3 [Cannabis sativa]